MNYAIRLPQGDLPLVPLGPEHGQRLVFDQTCYGSVDTIAYATCGSGVLQLSKRAGAGHVPYWIGTLDGAGVAGRYVQSPDYHEYNLSGSFATVDVVEGTADQVVNNTLDQRLAVVQPVCEACPEFRGMKGTYVVNCRSRSGGCCGGVSVNYLCPKGYWDIPLHKSGLFRTQDLSRQASPEFVASLIHSDNWPPRDIGAGWQSWPSIQGGYRAALASVPISNGGTGGRGIVMCAGGRYFVSGYATIRAIRHHGCTLPIELWILPGEYFSSWQTKAIEGLNVTVRLPASTVHGGWQLKYYAVLHSNFSEVLYLDADCFPLVDPNIAFEWNEYKQTGCYLWLDRWKDHQNDASPGALLPKSTFDIMGIPYVLEHTKDSGVMLIDKTRHHKSLSIADWMNRLHWQFYYRENHKGFLYGDKDMLWLSMRYLGETYSTSPKPWGATEIGGLHVGPDGKDFCFHNFSYKFMLSQDPAMRIAAFPMTVQHDKDADYPMREEMQRYVEDLREIKQLYPEKIHGVTVCINYDDYLLSTIGNKRHFDTWTIVTEHGDPAIKLAEEHGLQVLITDKKKWMGSKFNLGAMRAQAYSFLAEKYPSDWILSIDADVVLPEDCRQIVDGANAGHHNICGATRVGDGSEGQDNDISGFFQLFHAKQVLSGRNYQVDHHDAGYTDIYFRNLWRVEDRVVLPITVTHLGRAAMDWEGRVSFGPSLNAPTTHDDALRSLLRRPAETPDLELEPRWLEFFGRFIPGDKEKWNESMKSLPPIHNRWSYARWIWKRYAENGGTLSWDDASKDRDWPNSIIPGSARPRLYGVPVKVFGLQRTGTNLAAWQVTRNFSANLSKKCDAHWKHGLFTEDKWTDKCQFIMCVRHPLEQIASIYRYCVRHHDTDNTVPPQFAPSMTFDVFSRSECYDFKSPVHRWNEMTKHWLYTLPIDRTIIIRQEDQADNQLMVLRAIHRHLGLTRLSDSYTTSDAHVDTDMSITTNNPKNNPSEMFTPEVVDFVKEHLDLSLATKFGYVV